MFIDCQGTVMKFLPKIGLIMTAAAACAAGAATAGTPQAEQGRRAQPTVSGIYPISRTKRHPRRWNLLPT